MLTTLAAIGLGYVMGLMQGGIRIYKEAPLSSKMAKPEKQEYNDIGEVPEEVELYLTKTQGQIK